MSKEKQIEATTKSCPYNVNGECVLDETRCTTNCEVAIWGHSLIEGYRKQSEVIDDFDDLLIDFDEMGFCPTTLVPDPEGYAVEWKRKLVDALQSYRKQSEGEWVDKPTGAYGRCQSWCSACGKHSGIGGIESNRHKPFCPNCGAKMKGENK